MDEQDKITLVKMLLGQLPEKETGLLNRRLKNEPELNKWYENYKEAIQKIDLFYAFKTIESKVNSKEFTTVFKRFNTKSIKENNSTNMSSAGKNVLWVIGMFIISVFVTWGLYFYIDWQTVQENQKRDRELVQIQLLVEDSINTSENLIKEELRRKGIDFTGIAITSSGLFIAPYMWAHEGTILAASEKAINKIPATVLWDDKESGLSILEFAVQNQTMLKKLPYAFSKNNYFLGEEIVALAKADGKIVYNYGRVIKDDENADTLTLKMQLKNSIPGAPVLDNSGLIIGLVKNIDSSGFAVVQKSSSIYYLISEMNLDKGIDPIYLPSNNGLKRLSNPDKIRALSPFLVHFNVRKKH